MKGILKDPLDRQFAVILCPDAWEEDEDIILNASKNLIRKCNPHVGITVQPDYYQRQIDEARRKEDYRKEVVTKLFNVFSSERKVTWLQGKDIKPLQIHHRIDEFKAADEWTAPATFPVTLSDDGNTLTIGAYQAGEEFGYGIYRPSVFLNDYQLKACATSDIILTRKQ